MTSILRHGLIATAIVWGLFGAAAAGDCIEAFGHDVATKGISGLASVFTADLDNDGDDDFATASFGDDSITWFENKGDQTFEPRLIAADANGASAVHGADMDGDGDIDLLSASRNDNEIAWYENSGQTPPQFTRRIVSTTAMGASSVYAADIDQDGRMDILAASWEDDTIGWYENDGSATPQFTEHVITDSADGASSVFAADLNGDGTIDVLSASSNDDTIAWYAAAFIDELDDDENLISREVGFIKRVIAADADGATSVFAAKLDSDDHMDVISASSTDNKIAWYKNSGVAPVTFIRTVVSSSALGAKFVSATDVDDDGNVDILAASEFDDTLSWFENDGAAPPLDPSFVERVISDTVTSADAVALAKVDGDEFPDIVSVSSTPGLITTDDKIAWFRNLTSTDPISPWGESQIAGSGVTADAIVIADLNGDTFADIVVARPADNRISWYRNLGFVFPATPSFFEETVSDAVVEPSAVFVIDVNADGRPDVLSASAGDDKIAWYENLSTRRTGGLSFTEHVITDSALGASSVAAADVNGDDKIDIVAASAGDDTIAVYLRDDESSDTAPRFDPPRVIADDAEGARSVVVVDLDDDGDQDILAASTDDNTIAWYESDGVDPPTFLEHIISENALGARSVVAADLDNDDDLDVISASGRDNKIAWYVASEADLDLSDEEEILELTFSERALSRGAFNPRSVFAYDVDQDGDVDVLSASSGDGKVAWYENALLDNPEFPSATFSEHSTTAPGARSIVAGRLGPTEETFVLAGALSRIVLYGEAEEQCGDFDVDDDEMIDGRELVGVGRAFGLTSATPSTEWWFPFDFNGDGTVDGADLSILASPDVWGQAADECQYTCQ